MTNPAESDFETELDNVDQETTNPDEDEDEDLTLKDHDVLQLDDDNENQLDGKYAIKLEQCRSRIRKWKRNTWPRGTKGQKGQLKQEARTGECKDKHSGK